MLVVQSHWNLVLGWKIKQKLVTQYWRYNATNFSPQVNQVHWGLIWTDKRTAAGRRPTGKGFFEMLVTRYQWFYATNFSDFCFGFYYQ
jgi:hypothetical protein